MPTRSGRVFRSLACELGPADRVVDVGRAPADRRPRAPQPPVDRHHGDAVAGQQLVADLVGVAVGEAPGAAVQIDQRRERPVAARLVHLRQQRLVAVAEILDVLHVEFVGPGVDGFRIHGGALAQVWVTALVSRKPAGRDNLRPAACRPHGSLCFRGKMLSVPANREKPERAGELSCVYLNGTLGKSALAVAGVRGRLAGAAASAQAQSWPTRAVKFIVPFGPGAGADIGGAAVRREAVAEVGPAGGDREQARRRQHRRDHTRSSPPTTTTCCCSGRPAISPCIRSSTAS